jgi:hypothetical protein
LKSSRSPTMSIQLRFPSIARKIVDLFGGGR